jgi:hypothetical protein
MWQREKFFSVFLIFSIILLLSFSREEKKYFITEGKLACFGNHILITDTVSYYGKVEISTRKDIVTIITPRNQYCFVVLKHIGETNNSFGLLCGRPGTFYILRQTTKALGLSPYKTHQKADIELSPFFYAVQK